MFIQNSGLINNINVCSNVALGVEKMDRPHFFLYLYILEMPFDFSPNANVMRICSGVRVSIKHIQ